MLNPANRRSNQRYKNEEFKTPIDVWHKSTGDDTMRKTYELSNPTHYRALIYNPSAKDRDILGTRYTNTSLTVILVQQNGNIPLTDQIVQIEDERLGSGYYDIDEVIPDLTHGKNLKLLIHKTKYNSNQFKVVTDGEN